MPGQPYPADRPEHRPLLLACGALASELRAALRIAGLTDAVDVAYLPAPLHNRPERIVPAIEERLAVEAPDRPIVLGYADCGTGGLLDAFIDRSDRSIERLGGAHCYELFAGAERFAELHGDEPGTFYLTDFLARHFDALVWQGLGLDRHPELRDAYFGNYTRLVLLAQSDEPTVVGAARSAADRLGLAFVHEPTGVGALAAAVGEAVGVSIRKAVA